MTTSDLIGFTGVGLILLAYFLNLLEYWSSRGIIYLAVNFTGATLACWSSILIHSIPFTILEGTWALVSAAGLIQVIRRRQ